MKAPWTTRVASRLHWWRGRMAHAWGFPGAVAGVLLLAAAVLHAGLIPRLRTDLAQLRNATTHLRDALAQLQALPPVIQPGERLERLHAALPVSSDAAGLLALARLHEAAQSAQLTLEQGSYRIESLDGEPIARLDIIVNAKGSYPRLRGFAMRMLQADPALALASVRLGRSSAGEAAVDSELHFTLFMRKP